MILSNLNLDWLKLKSLPNNRIIRTMGVWIIIVPISAKLLTNDFFSKYELSLPFTWYCFFFAALCFSIGNVIFALFCPQIIKENKSLEDFNREGKLYSHIKAYGNEISYNFKRFGGHANIESPISIKEEFWPVFESAKTYRNGTRWACSIVYYLGFALSSYVIFENTYWVLDFIRQGMTNS